MKDEIHGEQQNLGKVNIRRGIFQGDSLPPLLFGRRVDSLVYGSSEGQCGLWNGEGQVKDQSPPFHG